VANLNQVTLIGRVTRDVETRSFANGGMVAKIGFVVDGKKTKDEATGKWTTKPVWLDVEAFNRGEKGKLASLCAEYLKKGSQCMISGKLELQEWNDPQGNKRSKLLIEADDVQFLDGGNKAAGQAQEQKPKYEAPNPDDSEAASLFK